MMTRNNRIGCDASVTFDSTESLKNLASKKISCFLKKANSRSKRFDLIAHLIAEASARRFLIQSYKTTAQLADGYNKSSLFERFSKDPHTQTIQRINPFDHQLKRVASQVIENYRTLNFPDIQEIMELANLSGMQHEEINIGVFNSLMRILRDFRPGSTQIPCLNKVKGIARMIRLLPPSFLSEEHADTVLNVLQTFSDWLGNNEAIFNDPNHQKQKLILILKIYTELLDALLDNKQLQDIDKANRGSENSGSIEGIKEIIAPSVLLNFLQNTLLQQPLNGIKRGRHSTDFFCQALNEISLNGDGLDPSKREGLLNGIKDLIDHESFEIKYLARYASECIARLPCVGDSRMAQIGQRSLHLLLAAKSLGVIVGSSGASLGEYTPLLQHAIAAMSDSRLPRNEWYYPARQIGAMMLEAGEDTEKLLLLVREIDGYLKKTRPAWELTYMMLTHLWEKVDGTQNTKLKNDVVDLLARIVLDVSNYGESEDVTQIAIDLLLHIASHHEKEIRAQARTYCASILERIGMNRSYWWCCFPPRLSKKVREQLDHADLLPVRDTSILNAEPIEENALLTLAKKMAFPLEVKVNDLRESVSRFCEETGVAAALKGYVPLKGAVSKYETKEEYFFSLEKKAFSFIARQKDPLQGVPTLLIHGPAGSGKSLFARYLENKLWAQYVQEGTIPLFISLPALKSSLKQAIEQALIAQGFTADEILDLKKDKRQDETKETWAPSIENGEILRSPRGKVIGENRTEIFHFPRLLVILDGYDEIGANMNIHEAYKTGEWGDIKVILTCRTEYLEGKQCGPLFEPRGGKYQEIFIRPFDDDQIQSFITQTLNRWKLIQHPNSQSGLKRNDYLELILKNKELKEIIEHPFMLEIVMNILPQLKERKEKEAILKGKPFQGLGKVQRYELYDLFMGRWFSREGERLRRVVRDLPDDFQPEQSFEAFAMAVATFMFKQKSQTITGPSINYTRIKVTEAEGALFFGDRTKELARAGAPFKRVGDMKFSFIHKSIQEFLVAKAIVNEIQLLGTDMNLQIEPTTVMNEELISTDPSILRFIQDEIGIKEAPLLLRIIEQTRQSTEKKEESPIAIAAANAATLLVRTPYALDGKDWSGIQIPGADLSGGIMYRMNLQNADWTNVKAKNLQMTHCLCDGMRLKGINTFELPWINVGNEVTCFAYSPDGKRLVSGSHQGIMQVWDEETKEQIGNSWESGMYPIRSVKYSPDGKSVICIDRYGYSMTRTWNAETEDWVAETEEKIHWTTGVREETVNIIYSLDGKSVAFVGRCGDLAFCDTETREQIKNPLKSNNRVKSVSYSPDGKRLVSAGQDNSLIQIWDAETGEQIGNSLNHSASVVIYSPDGKSLVGTSHDYMLHIWDAETGEKIGNSFPGHTNLITSISYSPDGKKLMSGSLDKTIRIWDTETSKQIINRLPGHAGSIESISYSPDGKSLVSGSGDGSIQIWDEETGEQIGNPLIGHQNRILSVSYSPDGKRLLSTSGDWTFRIWDVETGEQIGNPLDLRTDEVYVSYSPDGKRLVSSHKDRRLRIWDAETIRQIGNPLAGHEEAIRSVNYSPDGTKIVSIDCSTLRIWDAETRKQIGDPWELSYNSNLSFSPNGQKLLTITLSNKILIQDMETTKAIILSGHTDHVSNASYSPDGRRVVSGSWDGTLRIWDAETGEQIGGPLNGGHTGWINSVCYSPDGKKIMSGANDKTIRIWDISDEQNPKIIRIISNRNHPLCFDGNQASHVYSLSMQNKKLFEQQGFKIGTVFPADQTTELNEPLSLIALGPQQQLVIEEIQSMREEQKIQTKKIEQLLTGLLQI